MEKLCPLFCHSFGVLFCTDACACVAQSRCGAAAGCQGQEVCQEAVCREGTDEEDVSGPIFSRNYEYRVKHLRIDGIKMEHLNF